MNPANRDRLQKLHIKQPDLANPEFGQALADEALQRTRRFIAGVRAYQHNSASRDVPEAPVVWQSGTTCLRDYNPGNMDAPAVLVIPSLINRFDILDLDYAPSFLRFLASQGFRPLVVDWNAPGADERDFAVNDYVTQRLAPILDFVVQGSEVRGQRSGRKYHTPDSQPPTPKCHIVGYCMGGLLALALAALRPQQTRSLTLIATPWDFHRPDPAIAPNFITLADQIEPCLQALGQLPVDFIQSLFAAFQPLQALTKFAEFAGFDPLSPEARRFVLVEDWLNGGPPLTAPVARECFRGWYGENFPARLKWRVEGRTVDPGALTMPAYVIVPGKDRIVPPESALPLAKLLPHAALHEPMSGHIGLMASRHASRTVWAPLAHWLAQH